MRGLLILLLMFGVLWCGLDAGAREDAYLAGSQVAAILPADTIDHEGQSADLAHGGHHHHCPLAHEQKQSAVGCTSLADDAPLIAAAAPVLTSYAQAPPLEPPSA